MVVAKRFDTGSIWPLHNNPRGKFFEAPEHEPHAKPNKDLLLRDVIRASCAAPHYFEPETIEIAQGTPGAFIDGGVSPYNNPSLLLLMFVLLEGYGINWSMGQDRLLIVSLGTGYLESRMKAEEVMKMAPTTMIVRSFSSVLMDASVQAQTLLQWLAHSPNRREIDMEVGSLAGDSLGGSKLATYVRYDIPIDPEWLQRELDIAISAEQAAEVFAMDRFKNARLLTAIGAGAAERQVIPEHFDPAFDIG